MISNVPPLVFMQSATNNINKIATQMGNWQTKFGTIRGWYEGGGKSVFDETVILSIIITALVMIIVSVLFYVKVKKLKPNQTPKGIVLLVEWYFQIIEEMTVEMFGVTSDQYKKIAPYFAFLLFYFFFGDILGCFGVPELAQNYTLPLTNGIICLIGIFYLGIKHQRWLFLRKFCFTWRINNHAIPVMINPLEIIGTFTPIVSLTFRLWGNVFASVIVIAFCYVMGQLIGPGTNHDMNMLNAPGLILVGGFILAPLPHMLFDLFIDPIQAYVFVILNITYWAIRTNDDAALEVIEKIQQKKNMKQQKQVQIAQENVIVVNSSN